jgi:uncharacterized protein DUF4388
MRGAFEASGDIRGVDLLAAFVALWREKASGALRFSRPGATARFDFEGGEVVSSLSSQSQFDTPAILIRAGKLDAPAFERLEREGEADASAALLQTGLVTEPEWKWGQKIRAIEILSDVLGWLEGTYEFDAGALPSSPGPAVPIPRLLLELFLRSRDRTLIEHYLGPPDLPLLCVEDFDAAFETFGLTADAGSVVRLIDGRATAEEIAARATADEFAVLKLLAALTTLGLIHPVEAVSAPPRPPSPSRRHRRDEKKEPPRPKAPEPPGPEPEAEAEAPPPEQTREALETRALEEPVAPGPPAEPLPVLIAEPSPGKQIEALAEQGPLEGSEPLDETLPVLPFEPSGAPADLVPDSFEAPIRRDEETSFQPDFRVSSRPVDEAARVPEGRGAGVWLAGLLAVLVLAIAVIVIVRARGRAPEESAVSPTAPSPARENPVFPPAETAVPIRSAPSTPIPKRAATPALPAATRPPAAAATAAPTKTPARTPTRPVSTKTPTRTPTRPAPTRTPTPVPPTRRPPTALPPRAARTAAPRPAPSPSAQAAAPPAAITREDWLRRAERDRRALSQRRGARYAIQLEIACEVPTLERAWSWDKPPGTMWLLTSNYRGRTCFRVLWGRYATLEQARAAKARVPAFFVAPDNRPAIVSAR